MSQLIISESLILLVVILCCFLSTFIEMCLKSKKESNDEEMEFLKNRVTIIEDQSGISKRPRYQV